MRNQFVIYREFIQQFIWNLLEFYGEFLKKKLLNLYAESWKFIRNVEKM